MARRRVDRTRRPSRRGGAFLRHSVVYDLTCRSCGAEPSYAYVERHGEPVRRHLQK